MLGKGKNFRWNTQRGSSFANNTDPPGAMKNILTLRFYNVNWIAQWFTYSLTKMTIRTSLFSLLLVLVFFCFLFVSRILLAQRTKVSNGETWLFSSTNKRHSTEMIVRIPFHFHHCPKINEHLLEGNWGWPRWTASFRKHVTRVASLCLSSDFLRVSGVLYLGVSGYYPTVCLAHGKLCLWLLPL